MARLMLRGVTRRFGAAPAAVDNVSLEVAEREFLALLGPSGCGKTTLLRLIAGFEKPDSGEITIAGETMAGPGFSLPPEDRHLGMVFQSYALWPHMTVEDNVGFALSIRRVPKADAATRVAEALERVGLAERAKSRPAQLSGGQRQRVALARCLAMRPRIVLLDEPLANLDAHLRETMLTEFRRFHRELGTTFIYVTHDQAEAMALADRVAVMNAGRIEQAAAPQTLWRESASPMVARFIGAGTLVPVDILGPADEGHVMASLWGLRTRLRGHGHQAKQRTAVLRPKDVALAATDGDAVACRVIDSVYQGGAWRLILRPDVPNAPLLTLDTDRPPGGDQLRLAINDGWVLPEVAA
jgi:iron(III) transport system ATP-binding protein